MITYKKKRKQDYLDQGEYECDIDLDEDEHEDDIDLDDDEDDTEIEEIFDLSGAKIPKSKNKSKASSKAGAFSIVNAPMGHRITISSNTLNRIGYPKKVQILFKEDELVIGCELNKKSEKYTVKQDGEKQLKVIYIINIL